MTPVSRSYSRIAKTGVLWQYGSLLTELINIPSTMLLARMLTPQDFGIVAAASFFGRLAARLMNFGFNQALVRLKEIRPEHHSSVFLVNLATGLLLWSGLSISAPWLGALLHVPEAARVIPVFCVGFVVDALGSVPQALMARELRFWQGTVSGWMAVLATAITGVALAWHGFGFWSLVYSSLAGTIAQAITIVWLTRWRPRAVFSLAAMREIFSFGMGVHAKRLLDYGALNLDNMVVARVLGVSALGLYDKAFMMMNKVVVQLNLAGTGVSFRIFAIIHEEPERFRRAYCKVVMTATLISFPVLVGCIVVGRELIEALFGQQWLPAAVPFQLLCASGMLRLLNQYASSATQAIGWVWSEVWRQAIYASLIVGGIVVFSRWGLPGAAAAVLLATVVMTVLMHTMLIRATGLSLRELLRAQCAAGLCSAGLAATLFISGFLVRRYIGEPRAWQLLCVDVVTGGIFYAMFLLFTRLQDVRQLVDETLADFAPGVWQFLKTRWIWQAASPRQNL